MRGPIFQGLFGNANHNDRWECVKLKIVSYDEISKKPVPRIWLPKIRTDKNKLTDDSKHFLSRINKESLQELKKADYKVRFEVRDAKVKLFRSGWWPASSRRCQRAFERSEYRRTNVNQRFPNASRKSVSCTSANLLIFTLEELIDVTLIEKSWIGGGLTIKGFQSKYYNTRAIRSLHIFLVKL